MCNTNKLLVCDIYMLQGPLPSFQTQKAEWQPAAYPELRVSTVTPASIRALQRAGAWEAVESFSAPVTTMQVKRETAFSLATGYLRSGSQSD